MPNKSVIIAILAAAMAFGAIVSGCNRNGKRTAMNQPDNRRGQSQSVRPAEVLSASVSRPPASSRAYEPVTVAQAPVQSVYVTPVYSAPSTSSAQYSYDYNQPYSQMYPQSYRVHAPPDLAIAKANVPPAPAPYAAAPVQAPASFAPIPELEPVRYQRLPSHQYSNRVAAEIMVSSSQVQVDPRERQRALAPLTQAVDPARGWVASPTTAMRTGAGY